MERRVNEYALAMKNNQWMHSHQGIAFDNSGSLRDGQHRIMAIIQSGCSITSNVSFDVPSEAFDAVDRGQLRGIGQQLSMSHGIKNSNHVSSACRMIALICCRASPSMTVANTLLIEKIFSHSIRYSISSLAKCRPIYRSEIIGSLSFCHRAMPSELSDFICKLTSGEGLKRGSPVLTTRNYLLNSPPKNQSMIGHSACASALGAMHHVLGNQLTQIKYSNSGLDFFRDKQPKIVRTIRQIFGIE